MKPEPILTASEALYAFAGWLNVYDIVTDGVGLSEAVDLFCKTYHLAEPRPDWAQHVKQLPRPVIDLTETPE